MRKFKPEFRRHTALLRFLLHFAVRLIPGLVYEVQRLGRMVTADPPAFAVLPLIPSGSAGAPRDGAVRHSGPSAACSTRSVC